MERLVPVLPPLLLVDVLVRLPQPLAERLLPLLLQRLPLLLAVALAVVLPPEFEAPLALSPRLRLVDLLVPQQR